jgi:predicted PurR-regulated permease PerM
MARSSADQFAQLLFYGVVTLFAYLAYAVIRPFLAPLAWAAILAMTLNPLSRRIEARTGPSRAALATTLVAALVIVGPLAILVSALAGEMPLALEFVRTLPERATPERLQAAWDMVRNRVPVALPQDPTELISQGAQQVAAYVAPQVGSLVANVASTLASLVVMLFTLFFLLRDGHAIGDLIRRLLPFPAHERERLITRTQDLVLASVGAGLSVAAAQGLIGGLAFWGLGAGAPVAWGAAIAFASLIPVIGTWLVWAPVAVWWLLTGEVVRGLVLFGVGAGIIGMVDNVLRPILLSGRTSVNGLVIFIGLLGGVSAFGFVGLVLGPIVLVTAGTLLDALTRLPPGETPPVE